ncbi:hypothetical protein OG762_51700 (plasmid) [Streptomyces sp. NBC_01136]|uniref:hypothetical protein n=1 Tax=Streptomyces sp. NBC_01136 TaxID=2903754 RepID=UPI002F90F97E|nr:hypothetical protein OG762_51700 [Streptomyces sp. NBC_01136]
MDTSALAERLPARTAWEDTGTVVLPDVLPPDRFKALEEEAAERLDLVTPHVHDHTAAHRDGSFATPVHCGFIPPGPVLEQLAYDKPLLMALREATGIPRLIPRGGAVVLYRQGDFQGLHTDSSKSTVTVGIALTPDLPPMGWAPHLHHPDDRQLADVVAEFGIFPEGEPFTTLPHPYNDGSVRAFAGYHFAHWRPRVTVPGLLVTMSFMDL